MKIGIIGGAGAQGSGLAYRWAKAGHEIYIGSREPAKAAAAASRIEKMLGMHPIHGLDNRSAAAAADIAVLAVPFAAHLATLEEIAPALRDKILIDVTVPLAPPKVSHVRLPPSGSCVVDGQTFLGSATVVVSAFQNVSAHKLLHPGALECDIFICSDSIEARARVIALAGDAGMRGIDAGPLVNSTVAESLTSALIWINRRYGVKDAGIRVTGIEPDAAN